MAMYNEAFLRLLQEAESITKDSGKVKVSVARGGTGRGRSKYANPLDLRAVPVQEVISMTPEEKSYMQFLTSIRQMPEFGLLQCWIEDMKRDPRFEPWQGFKKEYKAWLTKQGHTPQEKAKKFLETQKSHSTPPDYACRPEIPTYETTPPVEPITTFMSPAAPLSTAPPQVGWEIHETVAEVKINPRGLPWTYRFKAALKRIWSNLTGQAA